MKRSILLLLICMLLALSGQAQKVKYKDLYFLLDTKQYDQAEPFLKSFLAGEKNIDHPNANYQMAMLLENKSENKDVLTETDGLVTLIDSALIYYSYATKYIDEKEARKNEEYYQAYKRRDIRTGKFGIKLADIQFDIEKKIEYLKDKKERVLRLKEYYNQMIALYDTAQFQFEKIKTKYPTTKVLYLRANDDLIESLDYLKKAYLITFENYEKYKSASGKIGGITYDQSLHEKEILDYENDGVSKTNFRDESIEIWDYNQWAEKVTMSINEKVIPLRESIVLHDNKLNKLKEKVINDSLSVMTDIGALSTQVLASQLKEFDEDPMPLQLFMYKAVELKYLSSLVEDKIYEDSLDVLYHLELVNKKRLYLDAMDSLLNLLQTQDIQEESKNYVYFVNNQFDGPDGLNNFIQQSKSFTVHAKSEQEKEHEQITERSRWLISESDSIPLFKSDSFSIDNFIYLPLSIGEHFTTGIHKHNENVEGYFAMIDPSRIPKVNVKFLLPSETFDIEKFEELGSLCTADENGQVNFMMIYQPNAEGKAYEGIVSKIYTVDGLAWTKKIEMTNMPNSLIYASDSGDLEIVQGEDNNQAILILDKKGNIKK